MYPQLRMMLDYICIQQPKLLDSTELREEKLLFSSKTYVAMIRFLLKCFESEYKVEINEIGIDGAHSSVITLCLLLEHAMAFGGSVELHSTAAKALVEIGSRLSKLVASRYVERISRLKLLLGHVDSDTGESASRLLGIACSALSTSAASGFVTELASLISRNNIQRFENHHGVLCALGYVTTECMNGHASNKQGGNKLSTRKPSFPFAKHHNIVEKQCTLYGWARWLIAHGLIQSADPNLVVHGKTVGSGNLKIALTEVVDPTCQLWLPDDFHERIGEVGVGVLLSGPNILSK